MHYSCIWIHCAEDKVHCSWDPQPLYSEKKKIKNESHGTIHTFKNYFVTVFSIFSKISGIQTHPNSHFHSNSIANSLS